MRSLQVIVHLVNGHSVAGKVSTEAQIKAESDMSFDDMIELCERFFEQLGSDLSKLTLELPMEDNTVSRKVFFNVSQVTHIEVKVTEDN